MSGLFHPLCGADPGTLARLLTGNGPVSWRHLGAAAFAAGVVTARQPLSLLERGLFALSPAARAPIPDPVFIVGYWRSGTTHLHNLLGRSRQLGYISPLVAGMPWDSLGIVRGLRPLLERALPEDRYIDRVAVAPDSPQEDSIALASMVHPSYYHGLYFPRRFEAHFRRGVYLEGLSEAEQERWERRLRYLLRKVSRHQGGKRLVIKNPVYTGEVARLRRLWPDARFIHIYRNPYVVFRSTRHFFTKLLEELAWQDVDPEQLPIDRLILESYPRLLDRLYADVESLAADRYVELRFETLEQDPIGEVERVYATLGLEGFDTDLPGLRRYLDQLGGYRKNRYDYDQALQKTVEQHWSRYLQRWGYAPP